MLLFERGWLSFEEEEGGRWSVVCTRVPTMVLRPTGESN